MAQLAQHVERIGAVCMKFRQHGPILRRLPRSTWCQNRILTIYQPEVYGMLRQAGPGNDINAGSPGAQKAPTWSPARLVSIWASPAASRQQSHAPLFRGGSADCPSPPCQRVGQLAVAACD
jgi:hypothetical protein